MEESWKNDPEYRDSIITRARSEESGSYVSANSSSENQNTRTTIGNLTPMPIVNITDDSSNDDRDSNNYNQIDLENLTPVPVATVVGSSGENESSEDITMNDSYEQSLNWLSNSDGNPNRTIDTSSEKSNPKAKKKKRSIHVPAIGGEGGVLEKLFGETKAKVVAKGVIGRRSSATSDLDLCSKFLPRQPAHEPVIERNFISGRWIVNLGDIASSYPTEVEAFAASVAYACPRMHSFHLSPNCFICEDKFAVFRRASHCRNCGVCICSHCSVFWPSKMIPTTFNIKNEDKVKVCLACDWLSHSFREALVSGNFDSAMALKETGNVNLRTPFANVKGETFAPVHAAVLGRNLQILQWLIEIECCPIQVAKMTSNAGVNDCGPLLVTSRGRSVVDIAIENKDIDILRYLVVERGASIFGYKDLFTVLETLDTVIRRLPPSYGDAMKYRPEKNIMNNCPAYATAPPNEANKNHFPNVIDGKDDQSLGDDACIICFNERIDCVLTPCGHQICCMKCSAKLTNCPVCNVKCNFIRTFRP